MAAKAPAPLEELSLALSLVPAGKVVSYKQLASWIGKPTGARLVGRMMAQVRSPHWYRVLRANGQLAFPEQSANYSRQADLLRAEGVLLHNGRVARHYFWQPGSEQ